MKKYAPKEELVALNLEGKIAHMRQVMEDALRTFGSDRVILAWTGGKDSTLLLWVLKELCETENLPMPRSLFINEGHVFDEIMDFVKDWTEKLGLDVDHVKNDDVYNLAKGVIGSTIQVADLDERNQKEIVRLKYEKPSFVYEAESYIGNHLMKTVAMNRFLEGAGVDAVITGIRWDEQDARKNETEFSPRKNPDHTRIHPILPFDEREIWDAHFHLKVPFCSLYREGYRSLGAAGTTTKTTDTPAWEQDLEGTIERGGRRQDKENLMERLRDLGYM
ncbi:phosphoadenosine phosphosulfate reductase family protein [bacterium]|nr:phosphoadenosine phosphosulfate reductase family protein [bacterium]